MSGSKLRGSASADSTGGSKEASPFVVDPEGDARRKAEERERRAGLSVAEKSTAASRASGTSLRFSELEAPKAPTGTTAPQGRALPGVQRTAGEKGTTVEFIEKKREMFLLEYSLGVKRDEMKRLEDETSQREAAIAAEERRMDEELSKYESLTKEYTLKAMEATKRAEAETKTKLERQTDVKRLTAAISGIKSEIAKSDEKLDDCRRYRDFLNSLAPSVTTAASSRSPHKEASGTAPNAAEQDTEEASVFKDPEQLLSTFKALEKRNLFLINHNMDTERVLEDLKQKRKDVEERMEKETAGLKAQIARLEADIARQKEQQAALRKQAEAREAAGTSQVTSVGTGTMASTTAALSATQADKQESQMAELREKVEEVYTRVVGENTAGMGTLQMVASIERRIDELLTAMAHLPEDYVTKAEAVKEKARRQRARDEQAQREKDAQQAKIDRAIERSTRPVPVRKGKPVMFRSYLPEKVDKKAIEEQRKREEEEADLRYFGLEGAVSAPPKPAAATPPDHNKKQPPQKR